MQSLNKNKIAYYSALSLLFSYAELFVPRILPFFKLGLSNIPVLCALDMPFFSFFYLCVIKSIVSSIINGTLLSPFFIISIAQSVCSGLFMVALKKAVGRHVSVFGLSVAGSSLSSAVQILLSAFYVGKYTLSLMGPMLIFSVAAGIITAYFSVALKILSEPPVLSCANENKKNSAFNIIMLVLLLLFAISVFAVQNIYFVLSAMVVAIVLQIISGRRFFILPHIFIWIFILIMSVFSPRGQVIFSAGPIAVTKGALETAVIKAAGLSAAAAISQVATSLKINSGKLLGLTFEYYSALIKKYNAEQGSFIVKIKSVLSATTL